MTQKLKKTTKGKVATPPSNDNMLWMVGFVMLVFGILSIFSVLSHFIHWSSDLTALRNDAALSGVDVRLMIPARSDNRISDYASYSYLGTLLEAGVKILLYTDGMLHCKTIVCDDKVSSVGSTNLDFRSFYYNFEVNAFVYDDDVACSVKALFLADERGCTQLTARGYAERSFGRRCLESAARLCSPVL